MTESDWDGSGRARDVVGDLVRDFGPQVLANGPLLRNLLGDKLPSAPRETSLLVAAAEAGVAGMLKERLGQQLPPTTAIRQAAIALEEQRGYDPVACSWVVTEFARALGFSVDDQHAATAVESSAGAVTVVESGTGSGDETVAQDGRAASGQDVTASSEEHATAGRSRRGVVRVLLFGSVAVIVVAVVLTVVLARERPVSVKQTVSGVAPAELALAALHTPFAAEVLPQGVSAPSRPRSGTFQSRAGLVVFVENALAGPDAQDFVDYFVFDTPAHAFTFYSEPDFADPWRQTGSFVAHGVGDTSRCVTGQKAASGNEQAQAESACWILSGNVVTEAATIDTTRGKSGNDTVAARLAVAGLQNLSHVANAASNATRRGGTAMSPTALLAALASKNIDADHLPDGLSDPQLKAPTDSNPSVGELGEKWVEIDFSGPDESDSIQYVVFNTPGNAKAYVKPEGTHTETVDASGLPSPAYCFKDNTPATDSESATGQSACFVQVGQVAVSAFVEVKGKTAEEAQDDVLSTLIRLGLLHLYSVDPTLVPR